MGFTGKAVKQMEKDFRTCKNIEITKFSKDRYVLSYEDSNFHETED